MEKKYFILFILTSLLTISSHAQEWETVVTMPSPYNASQLKVVNEDNMIIASQTAKLRRWNGTEWNTIGDFYNGFSKPYFFYISDDNIYATQNDYLNGDTENNYNYIAHWNGTEWTNANNLNVANPINNIHIINDNEMYAVGEFELPGYNWKPVAKYLNGSWSVLGLGDTNAGAYSTYSNLWVNNANDIYATSGYSDGGVIRVKHWDGNSWEVYYNGQLDEAERLSRTVVSENGDVYSFGYETNTGNSCIAKWNGEYWEVLGDIKADLDLANSANTSFLTIKYVNENEIYAIGRKLKGADTNNYKVAKWDGNSWSELGQIEASQSVSAMDIYDGYLYVTHGSVVKRFEIGEALSVQNLSDKEKIIFYPNPTKNMLSIKNLEAEEYKLSIYDMNGKLVLSTKTNNSPTIEMDLSNLNSGTYVIDIATKTSHLSTKLIKK